MKDLDNFSIPPELFYTKTTEEPKKRKILSLIPEAIKKKVKTLRIKTMGSSSRKRNKQVSQRPQLGTVNKKYLKNLKQKKKLLERSRELKSPQITPQMRRSANVSNITEISTISSDTSFKENKKTLADISNRSTPIVPVAKPRKSLIIATTENEEESERFRLGKMFTPTAKDDESKKIKKKFGSFKFFKSKNDRSDDQESNSEDEFSFTENEIDKKKAEPANPKILEPENFENGTDDEFDEDAVDIEALLCELDGDQEAEISSTTNDIPIQEPAPQKPNTTIQNVIDILEGTEIQSQSEDEYETDKVETKTQAIQEKKENKTSTKSSTKFLGFGRNQMQIDAGQKNFGVMECKECGFNYNTNVPEDELIHKEYHENQTKIPRFRGWQTEESYNIYNIGEENTRVIHLNPRNKNMTSIFVQELMGNMAKNLGVSLENYEKYHLYICAINEKMVGVCAVEESVLATKRNSDSVEKEEISLGIQRLYVRPNFRRTGVAKALLKTIAMKHSKGELLDVSEDIAFSSPTEDGIKFIRNLLKTDHFYVY